MSSGAFVLSVDSDGWPLKTNAAKASQTRIASPVRYLDHVPSGSTKIQLQAIKLLKFSALP